MLDDTVMFLTFIKLNAWWYCDVSSIHQIDGWMKLWCFLHLSNWRLGNTVMFLAVIKLNGGWQSYCSPHFTDWKLHDSWNLSVFFIIDSITSTICTILLILGNDCYKMFHIYSAIKILMFSHFLFYLFCFVLFFQIDVLMKKI